MQTLGQVAADIDTEYYSLGESIWCLLLMIKLWQKYVKYDIIYFAIYNIPPFIKKIILLLLLNYY